MASIIFSLKILFLCGSCEQADTDCFFPREDTERCYFVAMAQPVFMLFVVCITLYPLGVDAVPVPDGNTMHSCGCLWCTNKALLESLNVIVRESEPGIRHLGDIPAYAATSCQQLPA